LACALGGVTGIYSHVTEPVIDRLVRGLQRRWRVTCPERLTRPLWSWSDGPREMESQFVTSNGMRLPTVASAKVVCDRLGDGRGVVVRGGRTRRRRGTHRRRSGQGDRERVCDAALPLDT
jgi:hypothetical protein